MLLAPASGSANPKSADPDKGATRQAVVLVDGEEASGMASMLAGLLEDNLRDFAGRARCARLTRGAVVLTASDRDRSVTLAFGPGRIEVSDGSVPRAPEIAGPWLEMTKLCSGTLSPGRALIDRKLSLERPWHPIRLASTGFVLSVPASFYGEKREVPRWPIVAAGVTATAAAAAVTVISLRRHGAARRATSRRTTDYERPNPWR